MCVLNLAEHRGSGEHDRGNDVDIRTRAVASRQDAESAASVWRRRSRLCAPRAAVTGVDAKWSASWRCLFCADEIVELVRAVVTLWGSMRKGLCKWALWDFGDGLLRMIRRGEVR